MIFEKIKLDDMERCYAASVLCAEGRLYAVFASESEGGPCFAYSGERFSRRDVIWEKAGGTMSLVAVPGADGDFVAVQNFFPGFKSEKAKLVRGRRVRGGWQVSDLASLPFVHRFDLFPIGGAIYIFAATLCGSKKDREDWSDPGKILVGRLPEEDGEGVSFTEIACGQVKNHGYCRAFFEGKDAAFFSSDSGVFAAAPPSAEGGDWRVTKLIDRPVSDVAVCDLDGCGEDELITIEPFHGDSFIVNKKTNAGYEAVWRYPGEIEFAHTVSACVLCGRPAVIGGVRRKNCELFVLLHDKARGFYTELVEKGAGTSNAVAAHTEAGDVIIAANHTKNEAALYYVRDDGEGKL